MGNALQPVSGSVDVGVTDREGHAIDPGVTNESA
jgi:hypothetical protein